MNNNAYQLTTGPGYQGFFVRFSNGYGVSIQFAPSPLNYCDGGKTTAEVAVIDPSGDFVKLKPHSDTIAHCTPERMAEIIFEYSMIKKEEAV